MLAGNWVPLCRGLALPKDRSYGEVEAMYCLQRDYNADKTVTVAGYAALWGWSRGRVKRFLADVGVEIIYPKATTTDRKQRGHIVIHRPDTTQTKNEHKRAIDSKWLSDKADKKRTKNKHKTDIRQGATIDADPNPKPNPKTIEIPEWMPMGLWEDFLEIREKLQAQNTEGAQSQLVKKLERLKSEGQSVEDILRQSIMASWKTVYPIKDRSVTNVNNRPSPNYGNDAEFDRLCQRG